MSIDVIELSGSDIDRFFSQIRKEPSGCWIWAGTTSTTSSATPHGVFSIQNNGHRVQLTARWVSFIWHFGRLPTNKLVTSCGNTLCIAPDHIHEGIIKYDPSTIEHVSEDCHCTGKKCCDCKEVLCIRRFGSNRFMRDGLQVRCLKCNNKTAKRMRYGISRTEHQTLIDQSSGKCDICGIVTDDLDIDHNHTTGQVRGMLCTRCNTRLGGMDDKEWMSKALEYLRIHHEHGLQ